MENSKEENLFLEALSTITQLPTKRLFFDIKDLAWQWENIIEESDQTHWRHALSALHLLAHAYLRGLGYRMGNIQGFRSHHYKLALLCSEIIRYVVEEGPIIFTTLHRYGFSSLDKALEVMKAEVTPNTGILAQAEQILRESQ